MTADSDKSRMTGEPGALSDRDADNDFDGTEFEE